MSKPKHPRRRAFLGALAAAVPLPVAAASIVTTRESADRSAAALADAMARLHGGKCHAHIDHKHGFILIRELGEREGGAA